jgi:hypothetical protein
MTRAMNIEGIEKATGRSWDKWVTFLERVRARDLSHTAIAQKVSEREGVTNWWAQTIAVAYEQYIGRRRPGQTSDRKYQVTVSRTVDGTLDDALHAWLAVVGGRQKFSGVSSTRDPTTSRSGKFRYWHCALRDGSRVSVGISLRQSDRAVIGLAHHNLKSPKHVERWRAYWKSLLAMIPGGPVPRARRNSLVSRFAAESTRRG